MCISNVHCLAARQVKRSRYVTGVCFVVGYGRSCAIFRPSPTWARSVGESTPASEVNLLRSSVVTWWHSATLSFVRPPAPAGSGTAVGPRRACDADVDTGTAMMDRHPGVWLNASCEIMITGRVPCCSDPDRGARLAQYTSPRFTGRQLARSSLRHPASAQRLPLPSPHQDRRMSPRLFARRKKSRYV